MRRNKILIFMLVMVCVVLVSGCSFIVQRDSLNVQKALIGHWANSKGTPDYYFSDSGFTKVEKDGSKTEMTYVVLKSNDKENTITIRETDPKGGEQDKDIKFSADKKTMTETVNVLGIKYSEDNYTYVDSKTKP